MLTIKSHNNDNQSFELLSQMLAAPLLSHIKTNNAKKIVISA